MERLPSSATRSRTACLLTRSAPDSGCQLPVPGEARFPTLQDVIEPVPVSWYF
jgi:hypothetical protein